MEKYVTKMKEKEIWKMKISKEIKGEEKLETDSSMKEKWKRKKYDIK